VDLWNLVWIFFILSSLQPVVQRQVLAMTRRRMLAASGATVHARSGLRHAQVGSCTLTAGAKVRVGRAG
jgi:hypothetical protein